MLAFGAKCAKNMTANVNPVFQAQDLNLRAGKLNSRTDVKREESNHEINHYTELNYGLSTETENRTRSAQSK